MGDLNNGDRHSGKKILVCRNEAMATRIEYFLSNDITWKQFLRQVSRLLDMKKGIKKIYRSNGSEVTALPQISNNDVLYMSNGEIFYQSSVDSFSVAVLGAAGVGKSAITLRFIRNVFIANWEPTIEDAFKYTLQIDDQVVNLNILDTAGQEDFSSMRTQWMSNQDGLIFVYSVVDRDSIYHLFQYVDLLEQIIDDGDLVPPVIFVGNKADLVRDGARSDHIIIQRELSKLIEHCHLVIERINEKFETFHLHKLGNQPNLPSYRRVKHVETSALRGDSIQDVFTLLVREIRCQKHMIDIVNETQESRKKRLCLLL